MKLPEGLKNFKPFPEPVAWSLFKYAAIGEAVGWSLLIPAVIMYHYKFPGYHDALVIGGQFHGMLFIFYLFIVLAGFNSLSWSPKRTIIAVLVSVPPYGTLIFEQWAARERRVNLRQSYRRVVVRAVIRRDGELLAIQPGDRPDYYLPGGYIQAKETAEQALDRVVFELTGIRAIVGRLMNVRNMMDHHEECIEFYFMVNNSEAYRDLDLEEIRRSRPEIDVIGYVKPGSTANLVPTFLQKRSFMDDHKNRELQVAFES